MPDSPSPTPSLAVADTARPADVHEWISIEDETELRTWVVDATFLRSNWSCIYGNGCQGVLDADATEMAQGCCSYGAHFVDEEDVQTVVSAVVRLTPKHWQFAKKAKKHGFLAAGGTAADGTATDGTATDGTVETTTRLVDDACIFLNRPGFEGGPGCALHRAALAAGERPMDWKPNVCWQLPLRLDHHTDDNGYVTSTLREWKRRDWGPGGQEFHWWCTETHEAFVGANPVYEYLRDEIIGMVGQSVYDRLVPLLTRPKWTPLPHPAVKRR